MGDSRANMPLGAQETAERNEKPAASQRGAVRRPCTTRPRLRRWLLRRLHLTPLVQRHEEWVRIPRYQTAELLMAPGLKDGRPQPMVLTCPRCSEKEETRLLSVVLAASPTRHWRKSKSSAKRIEHARILLRITQRQLNDINAEFATRPPSPRRRPESKPDRELVLGSLVP
jgi:hypothetical protein